MNDIITNMEDTGMTTEQSNQLQALYDDLQGKTSKVYKLGSGTNFNVSHIDGYQNFTIDNFIISYKSISLTVSVDGGGSTAEGSQSTSANISKSYNASTGVLTINGGTGTSKGIEYYGAQASASSSISFEVLLVTAFQ